MRSTDSYTVANRSFSLNCKDNCLFPVEIINLVACLKRLAELVKRNKTVLFCKFKCRCGKLLSVLFSKRNFLYPSQNSSQALSSSTLIKSTPFSFLLKSFFCNSFAFSLIFITFLKVFFIKIRENEEYRQFLGQYRYRRYYKSQNHSAT